MSLHFTGKKLFAIFDISMINANVTTIIVDHTVCVISLIREPKSRRHKFERNLDNRNVVCRY